MKFARRIESVHMSGIRRMFAAAGSDAINLGLGEPDFDPPQVAKDALKRAVDAGHNCYGPTAGLPLLRNAVADYCKRYADISADQVIITPSGTSGIMSVMQSLVDEGDEVLVPDPGFVLYAPHTVLAGGRSVPYAIKQSNDFLPDPDELQSLITSRTRAIVINSPANPTGGVLDRATYDAICDIAEDAGIIILSDEVNDNFVYEGEHESFTRRLDIAVVVQSFSKSLAMTGWRIGYLVVGEGMWDNIAKMQYYMTACPATPIQHAVAEALPHVDEFAARMLSVFRRRRSLIVDRLNDTGVFECTMPKGAFYAFPSFDLPMTSEELAERIVGAGVICTPGNAFGANGEGHIRFSYAASEENITHGMDIIEDVLSSL